MQIKINTVVKYWHFSRIIKNETIKIQNLYVVVGVSRAEVNWTISEIYNSTRIVAINITQGAEAAF